MKAKSKKVPRSSAELRPLSYGDAVLGRIERLRSEIASELSSMRAEVNSAIAQQIHAAIRNDMAALRSSLVKELAELSKTHARFESNAQNRLERLRIVLNDE